MAQRGRKSAAELAVVPVGERIRRPLPPEHLTEEQRSEWRAVVERMPADWFHREHFPILADYVRHACRARFLASVLDRECSAEHLATDKGLAHFDKMAAAAERETRAALACARALRITHQSQVRPETAARRRDAVPSTRPRWT